MSPFLECGSFGFNVACHSFAYGFASSVLMAADFPPLIVVLVQFRTEAACSLRTFASDFANFAVWIHFYRKEGRQELAKDRKAN